MNQFAQNYTRWTYAWAILRRWYASVVYGSVIAAAGAFTLVRSEILPASMQSRLATPQLPLQIWIGVSVVAALYVTIESGFQIWQEEHRVLLEREARIRQFEQRLLPVTAPEVEIGSDRESDMGVPDSLLIRNVSRSENIHSVCFQPQTVGKYRVVWTPEQVQTLAAGQFLSVKPATVVHSSSGTVTQVGTVTAMLMHLDTGSSIIDLGSISFTCEDRARNRYMVSARLHWDKTRQTLSVAHVERQRIS